MTAIVFAILTFFSTGLGGLFALYRRRQLYLVMGFAAGVLVAAALLDLFPDALELVARTHSSSAENVFLAAVVGFLVFYGLDELVHRLAAGHEHHEHHEHHDDHTGATTFGTAAALGLTIHSLLDGFAIGSAFRASNPLGLLVALAVIAHDFGDGVSTVGVVLGSRGSFRASVGWLIADALAPVAGATAALWIALPEGLLAALLGFFAGSFLFIGAAHLLPEAQAEGRAPWLPVALVGGFLFVFLATRLLK